MEVVSLVRQLLQVRAGSRQVFLRKDMVGIDFKGPLEIGNRFFVTTDRPERAAQVQLGTEIFRIHLRGALQVWNSFRDAAGLAQQSAEADICVQGIRLDRKSVV